MSEPQLERSVLEAKEREELFAIANALGTKPTSRARKSELVSQILQATGVEVVTADTADKPRRTRTRRASAAPAAEEQLPLADEAASTDADGAARQPPPDEPIDAAETETQATEAATAGADADLRAAPAPAPEADADTRGADAPAPAPEDAARAAAPPPAAPPDATPASRNGRAQGEARPRAGDRGSGGHDQRPSSSQDSGRQDSGRQDSGRQDSGRQDSGRQDSGRHGPSDVNTRAANGADPDAAPGSDEHGGRFDNEPGNRRSRRRRGRDRGGERTERELPGQAPEQAFTGEPVPVTGFLDLRDEGYGFLRTDGYLPGPNDVYVSISQVRRFALRRGDQIEGGSRPAGGNEKYPALVRVDRVSGLTLEAGRSRPRFESLTPLFPDEKLRLELAGDPANLTARIVDLLAPIGKGQRGLIVSPPKAGKTTVLKHIAHSIEANNPDVHLMILLVDERPEEVTDIRRSVKGEVVASTFDRPSEEHTQVAELAIERAKRMVELGRDVVIVLDGITRLARAYNLAQPATGRIMSGGIDTGALYPPKKFFGAARNIEEGGSLTILATALVETGSKMDEVIFEEFKGTGNMELRLDRKLAERRVYPAIDVNASSTRHEELLFDRVQLQQVWKLRRVLNALGGEGNHAAGLELLLDRIKATRSNDEFLAEIAKNPAPGN
jgi:transcription termination factor Rho